MTKQIGVEVTKAQEMIISSIKNGQKDVALALATLFADQGESPQTVLDDFVEEMKADMIAAFNNDHLQMMEENEKKVRAIDFFKKEEVKVEPKKEEVMKKTVVTFKPRTVDVNKAKELLTKKLVEGKNNYMAREEVYGRGQQYKPTKKPAVYNKHGIRVE